MVQAAVVGDLTACSDGGAPIPASAAETPQACFSFLSLDELFPNSGFSEAFALASFRDALRSCIRADVFTANLEYRRLSDAAQAALLYSPASSVQGSWRIDTPLTDAFVERTLGLSSSRGSSILSTIGALCGEHASGHFIDIVGVTDRPVTHSWHQDTGREGCTILWGFPKEDHYHGCGVYSHILKLRHKHFAPPHHATNEPILFQGSVPDDCIVRPGFAPGRELLVFHDVDVLHSAPDVTYRSSVMRFM